MMLSLPLVFWLGELNQSVPLPEWMSSLENDVSKQLEAFLKYRGPAGVFLNLVIIALLPAIGEELCFRSVMQRIIIQLSGNAWAGILITAFLFSALHLQFEGFLPRMFLGGILGVLYWYSGSIWTAILAHFTNNAVQVLFVSYFPQYIKENPSIPLLLVVASSVSVGAVIMYYKNESRQTFTRVYRSDGTDTNLPYSA
jgi:membrane protease YdiL (CAAX protease family)